jgi:holo-[acyl-carrier protein] synthase
MIFGIGTDIVQVARMRGSLERFGESFARRILTLAEFNEFRVDKRPAQFLAKRFAAKEALVKAMGTGFRGGVKLSDVGVTHNDAGKPGFYYGGRTEYLLREWGVVESHLSVADEEEYAVAFVILLTGMPGSIA